MSDRPMRLKYVTKMKIMLCIFLLYITAVSVFGQSVELNGILGESVNFTAAVKINGNLRYSGVPIGEVTGGSFKRARSKFSGRLQWDSSTGLFSLSGLRLEDSGVFTVQNSDEPRPVSFSLTVKVVGQLVELNDIVGESVKFPAAVKKGGSLMYSGVTIGDVTGGSFRTTRNEKFSGRLHWDSSTGLFSLSGLKMEDIGEYEVQNTDQNINTVFQLNVYKDNVPVSKPNVIFYNEYCTIECTAERGTGVTLSWYREGEEKPYATSPVESAPYLHLPVPVEGSGTYICEVKNSVSNEKASITVEPHCAAPAGPSPGTIVAIFIAVVAVLIAVVLAVLYRHIRSKHPDEEEQTLSPQDEDEQTLSRQGIRSKHPVQENIEVTPPPASGIRSKHPVQENIEVTPPPASDEERQAFIHDVQENIEVTPPPASADTSLIEETSSNRARK